MPKGRRMHCHGRTLRWAPPVNKCHEWMSGRTSPINKCRATGRRKYAFPDPGVFFYVSICTTTSHNIGHLFLITMNKCAELKVCVSGPMFIGLLFLFWWVVPPLKLLDTFLTLCIEWNMVEDSPLGKLVGYFPPIIFSVNNRCSRFPARWVHEKPQNPIKAVYKILESIITFTFKLKEQYE